MVLKTFIFENGLTWKVFLYLNSPISIVQRAYIPKNGVEFHQQSNGDNKTGVVTSYDLARRRLENRKLLFGQLENIRFLVGQ